MSFIESIKRKFSSASSKRIEAAADQLYMVLATGRTIEIPAIHSMESDVTAAVLRLREKYPHVFVNMLQSKGIVLTKGSGGRLAVSDDAVSKLDAAGYFPDPALPPEVLFDMHRIFQDRNARVDPIVAEMEALEAQRKQDAITVGAVGGASETSAPETSTPETSTPETPASSSGAE